jgi:hypothetical protein
LIVISPCRLIGRWRAESRDGDEEAAVGGIGEGGDGGAFARRFVRPLATVLITGWLAAGLAMLPIIGSAQAPPAFKEEPPVSAEAPPASEEDAPPASKETPPAEEAPQAIGAALPGVGVAADTEAQCAVSGEQILAGNVVKAAVYQEQFSRYDPRTHRCFVEMRVLTIAADEHADRSGRFLYDGQTQELLAFAEIRNRKKSGRVFDLNHRTRSFENSGWDDASEYIYAMMAGGDR